jgi:hypothetical protein
VTVGGFPEKSPSAKGTMPVAFARSSPAPQRTIGDERLRDLAKHLHRLGPRPTFEFLREVAAGADLYERLEQYARLDPSICKYLGASEML